MNKVIRRKRFNSRKFMQVFLLTMTLLIILPVIFQSAANGVTEVKYQTVQVHNGDSLWSIATQYTPPGKDIRDCIDKIMDFNSMQRANLTPGQEIKIPADL